MLIGFAHLQELNKRLKRTLSPFMQICVNGPFAHSIIWCKYASTGLSGLRWHSHFRVFVLIAHCTLWSLTWSQYWNRGVSGEGYSNCVCVCVCPVVFPFSYELAKKTYGSPERCNRLIKACFLVKQPLCKATKFALKLLAHMSGILLALAGTQACI